MKLDGVGGEYKYYQRAIIIIRNENHLHYLLCGYLCLRTQGSAECLAYLASNAPSIVGEENLQANTLSKSNQHLDCLWVGKDEWPQQLAIL